MQADIIEVCAAIVFMGGRMLLATRRPGAHLAGLWEFPGGKVRQGESVGECIKREMREELCFDVINPVEIFALEHSYPEKTVRLHFMMCFAAEGAKPVPAEGQSWGLFASPQLKTLDMAPADARAVAMLKSCANGSQKIPGMFPGEYLDVLRIFWKKA